MGFNLAGARVTGRLHIFGFCHYSFKFFWGVTVFDSVTIEGLN